MCRAAQHDRRSSAPEGDERRRREAAVGVLVGAHPRCHLCVDALDAIVHVDGQQAAVRKDGVVDDEHGGVLGQLNGHGLAGRVQREAGAHKHLQVLQLRAREAHHHARLRERA